MNLEKATCKLCKNFEFGICLILNEKTDDNGHCYACEVTLGTIMNNISNHNGITYDGQISGQEKVLRKQVNNDWVIINKVTGVITNILPEEAARIIVNIHSKLKPNYKLIYEI